MGGELADEVEGFVIPAPTNLDGERDEFGERTGNDVVVLAGFVP